MVWRYLALLGCITLWSSNGLAQTKVLLMPVTGVGDGISDSSKNGMVKALKEEFKARGNVFVIDGRYPAKARKKARPGRKRKTDSQLKRAISKMEDARRQMERLKFDRVIKTLVSVTAQFEKDIDLLEDYEQLVDANLMLAVAYIRRGKTRKANKVLAQLLTVRPALTVDPRDYANAELSKINRARQKMLRRGTGTIRIPGNGDATEVFLNGRLMGRAPLLIENVVVGKNHIRISGSGRSSWGQIAQVTKDTTTMVMDPLAVEGESGSESLQDKIKINQFDDAMRRELRSMGRKRGADYIVVLGLGSGAGLLNCGGYIGDVRSRTWSRLRAVSPDVDMLSAGIEASTLVSSIEEELKGFSDPVRGEVKFLNGVMVAQRQRRPRQQRERTIAFMNVREVEAAERSSAPAVDRIAERAAEQKTEIAVRKPRSRSSAVPKRQDLIPSEAVDAAAAGGLTRLDLDTELKKSESGDSIVDKWWFWTSIAVAVAGAGVGTYFLAVHEGEPTDVNVSVSW